MTPSTCGRYMQPCWSSVTAFVGTCQFLSGRPAFTQTKTFFRVPFPLTTTSSDFAGLPWWARSQYGVADISSVFIAGLAPSKATLPVTVPPFASSGVADPPPPAAGALSALDLGASVFSPPPPHPDRANTQANPAPIQIFVMLLSASSYDCGAGYNCARPAVV